MIYGQMHSVGATATEEIIVPQPVHIKLKIWLLSLIRHITSLVDHLQPSESKIAASGADPRYSNRRGLSLSTLSPFTIAPNSIIYWRTPLMNASALSSSGALSWYFLKIPSLKPRTLTNSSCKRANGEGSSWHNVRRADSLFSKMSLLF